MTTNPKASSDAVLKTTLLKAQGDVNKALGGIEELRRAVEGRIEELERQQDELQARLTFTEEQLFATQNAVIALEIANEEQADLIHALRRRRGDSPGSGSDADGDDESDDEGNVEVGVAKLNEAKYKREAAMHDPAMKNVVDEAFRRTLAVHKLKPDCLPAFEAFTQVSDDNPLRFHWDKSPSDPHNQKNIDKVVKYVVERGAIMYPSALLPLKILDREDVRTCVRKKFTSLAKAFCDHHAVAALNKKRDEQLARAASRPAEGAGPDNEGADNDAMEVDGPAEVAAVKIAERKEKKRDRAGIQRARQRTSKWRRALRERLPTGDSLLDDTYDEVYIEQVQSAWEDDPDKPGGFIAHDRNFESAAFKAAKRIEERADLRPANVSKPKRGRQPITLGVPRRIPQEGGSASEDVPQINTPELKVTKWMVDEAWLARHPGALQRMRNEGVEASENGDE